MAFDPGDSYVFRRQREDAELEARLCKVYDQFDKLPPDAQAEFADKLREMVEKTEQLLGRPSAARLRAVDAQIAAQIRELERQVKVREREEAAHKREEQGRANTRPVVDRVDCVRRAREAYDAACDLRRAGIDVGHAVSAGVTSWAVASHRNDRRRRGRLPHEEDLAFDDVVRLFDR